MGKTINLWGGNFILFPHGMPHKVMDKNGRACMAGEEVVKSILSGQHIFSAGDDTITLSKDALGITPMKYLTQWRMTKAKELLRNLAVSVFEAAGKVGYATEASFIRAFKQLNGFTPTSFRRKIIAGQAP